ncbi:chorismate mutase [Acinetobacter stercoris]|uniref:chorismate mutase n=1 Tax=Acinetobacter stercoris TaxID=2126983 RepID=A0A2U3MTV4_9GAMM|nr:chorismate mutase [Acinetobacter stercoris]SPL68841.1 Secreted chorismate mutase precursor [Acinetobacter stercoris]
MLKSIIFVICLCCSLCVQATTYNLIDLINARLGLMKDVAGSKAIHYQAIEDLAQEDKVLQATLNQAAQKGIDSSSIQPFIIAQMDAAKAIQYRYRADWLAEPETNWQPKDLNSVRSEISQLSSDIVDSIANELYRQGNLDHFASEKYKHRLNQKNLSSADKSRLLSTLKQIHLR